MGGVSGWLAAGAARPKFTILLVSGRVIGGAMTLVQERKARSVLAAVLRLAKYVATLVVLGTAYFVLARAGLMLASVHPSATPIWPATGLAIGCMLVFGLRVWPAVLLGAFAANATNELANLTPTNLLIASSAIAVGNTLEALISAGLLNLWANGRNPGRRRKVCPGRTPAGNDAQRDHRVGQPRAHGRGGLGERAGHLVHLVARRRRQCPGCGARGGVVGD